MLCGELTTDEKPEHLRRLGRALAGSLTARIYQA